MIRKLEKKYYEEIERMILESQHMYHPDFAKKEHTYVLDDEPKGFFTYMMYKDTPVLQQFYIDPKFRNIKNGRRLVKGFCDIVKKYKHAIISAEDPYKYVEYYFKTKPVKTIGRKRLYLVEV